MMPDEQVEALEWRLSVPRWYWVFPLVAGSCMMLAFLGFMTWEWLKLRESLTPPPGVPLATELPASILVCSVFFGSLALGLVGLACPLLAALRIRPWALSGRVRAASDGLELWPTPRGPVTVPWGRVQAIYYEHKHWGRIALLPAVLVVETDRRRLKVQQRILPEAEEVARILSERLHRARARAG